MGQKDLTSPRIPLSQRHQVILGDPYPVILYGLRKMLEDGGLFHVVAEVSTMALFWKTVVGKQPQVALLDWRLAAQSLDVTNALVRALPQQTSLLFLTASETFLEKRHVPGLGTQTFLSKWCSAEGLQTAVMESCKPLHSAPAAESESSGPLSTNAEDVVRLIRQLTKRELQLLPLVCRGMKNKEIAEQLGIAESTVWHHLTSVFTKLEVGDRLGLATFAYRNKLVQTHDALPPMRPVQSA